MRRNRCAKIVATLGPASSTKERIRALADAGADVFRFNFSHGSHADHAARFALLREVEQERGRPDRAHPRRPLPARPRPGAG